MRKVSFLVAVISVLFFSANPIEKNQKPAPTPATNGYPKMNVVFPDGSMRSARDLPAKSIFVFYFPDCDHCQREAADFSKHLAAFKNYHIWFIAVVPFPEIKQFAIDYKLIGYDNVHFVRTEPKDITDNYGGISTPSVYIYSKDKKLVKAFNGETKVEEIIKFL
jgi:thiol-disulfide isomerase/thioredoxin